MILVFKFATQCTCLVTRTNLLLGVNIRITRRLRKKTLKKHKKQLMSDIFSERTVKWKMQTIHFQFVRSFHMRAAPDPESTFVELTTSVVITVSRALSLQSSHFCISSSGFLSNSTFNNCIFKLEKLSCNYREPVTVHKILIWLPILASF